MKTGLTKYNKKPTNNKSKEFKKAENKFSQYKFTSGWVTFALITIIFIAITLIGYYASKLPIVFSLSIASGVCFCLNIFWLISRQKFNKKVRWIFLKYYKKLKLDNVFFFGSSSKEDFAYNHVENQEEFSDYLDEKVKKSTLAFWISFALYSIVLVAFIIVAIVTSV